MADRFVYIREEALINVDDISHIKKASDRIYLVIFKSNDSEVRIKREDFAGLVETIKDIMGKGEYQWVFPHETERPIPVHVPAKDRGW